MTLLHQLYNRGYLSRYVLIQILCISGLNGRSTCKVILIISSLLPSPISIRFFLISSVEFEGSHHWSLLPIYFHILSPLPNLFYQLNMNGTLTSISWYIYHYTILIFIVEFEGGLLRSHYLFHLFPPLPYLFVIFSFWRGTLASYPYVICRIWRGTQEVLFTLSTRECLLRSTFLSIATYFLVLI